MYENTDAKVSSFNRKKCVVMCTSTKGSTMSKVVSSSFDLQLETYICLFHPLRSLDQNFKNFVFMPINNKNSLKIKIFFLTFNVP